MATKDWSKKTSDMPVGVRRQWRADRADHETGRPALYDNAIDTDYTHSIGIQKGQI
ncbi:hypothetical protein [Corynebacterium propinquum]|uniref:hypothetical protein n=1 Tax=Corynebacterium propinquum TaxID=43769 RepID=UPI00266FBBCC|nr:hypothetical protein [Corynebacterium propinquum]WKS43334.1 hypothetical protein NLL42_02755 [Corynebacterium propinquum]